MAFNPQQPRVPAGQPGGGQWAGHGSEAAFREHFAKQMRGQFGVREVDIQRRLDVMVKEHLETVAARAEYHATRRPGPTLPPSLRGQQIDALQSAHARATGQALPRHVAAEMAAGVRPVAPAILSRGLRGAGALQQMQRQFDRSLSPSQRAQFKKTPPRG